MLTYAVLTFVGVAISTEPAALGDAYLDVDVSKAVGPSTAVPPAIYLYGFLGAMAYAFTSVVAKFERGLKGVVRVGLRVLAALPLAAGVFLLAGALGIEATDGRLIVGGGVPGRPLRQPHAEGGRRTRRTAPGGDGSRPGV